MRIQIDPSVEAGGFGWVESGKYSLRVKKVEQIQKPGSAYPYLKWEFEFADPNVQAVPQNGKVMKVGNVFENTSLDPKGQFRLRQLVEALGLTWSDFDTESCIGGEFEAQVKIDLYEDNYSNKVSKYIPKG